MSEESTNPSLTTRLLHDYQQNFPICPAPFAELAGRLGVAENVLLRVLEQLRREGRISRVGAVFAPKRIGASTLAVMAVPPDKLDVVARAVNRFPEVNHNYEREHRYNLWFVVTAGSEGRLQAALGAIEQAAGYPVVALPMLRDFRTSVEGGEQGNPEGRKGELREATVLDEIGRRLVMALQEGLPLFIRPFSILASRVGCEERELLERIRSWCAEGAIKRFGVIVRSQEPDEGVNAMLVHDVPDGDVVGIGGSMSREPAVSLCYERSRALPDWPYNLYCIMRGATREDVRAGIDVVREKLGLTGYASETLFSLTRFKRDGVRYA
jgi:DNA-binding Lrp family transcriptional regulator